MQLVLIIQDKQLEVYELRGQKLVNYKSYSLLKAREYLEKLNKKTKIYLVLDLAGEDLTLIQTPKLYSWEKTSFIKRLETKQRSLGKDLSAFIWTKTYLNNPKNFRQEETLINFSLELNQTAKEVLQLIESRILVLMRIESASYLWSKFAYKPLVKQLNLNKNFPVLTLIQVNKTNYKLFFFKQGFLYFARTIQAPQISNLGEYLLKELELSKQFILEQNFIDTEELITCALVADVSLLRSFPATSQVELINSSSLFRTKNAKNLAEIFAWKTARNLFIKSFYKTPYLAQVGVVLQISKLLQLAIILVIVLGAFNWRSSFLIKAKDFAFVLTPEKRDELFATKNRLLNELDNQVIAENLIKTLDFSQTLGKKKTVFETSLFPHKQLAQIFAAYPNIQLKSLAWQVEDGIIQVKILAEQVGRGGLQALNEELQRLKKDLVQSKFSLENLQFSSQVLLENSADNYHFTQADLSSLPLTLEFQLNLEQGVD